MSIKPIDLQTNVGQIHEVARNQQVKSEAIVSQMHSLDKESDEKSKLNKSRLEENKKAEHTGIRPDDQKEKHYHQQRKSKDEQKENKENKNFVDDPNLGRLIDIKK